MVSDGDIENVGVEQSPVLILVLMEYGLWPKILMNLWDDWWVLILVLMEYGLWRTISGGQAAPPRVLILVLMEYGLWHNIRIQWRTDALMS